MRNIIFTLYLSFAASREMAQDGADRAHALCGLYSVTEVRHGRRPHGELHGERDAKRPSRGPGPDLQPQGLQNQEGGQYHKTLVVLVKLRKSLITEHTVADPEISERGGGQETWSISRCTRQPSFYDYFSQARGGGMAPLPPPPGSATDTCHLFNTVFIYLNRTMPLNWFVFLHKQSEISIYSSVLLWN